MGRATREHDETTTGMEVGGAHPEFRLDLERIRFSPSFARLASVTQVISQPGSGAMVHNRLTHSIKVTAVARAIAVRVAAEIAGTSPRVPAGSCDAVVVQAAASAHDLGHPPFGHLGESVLDRIARTELGLPDGFEGNAQTYRIVTALDVVDGVPAGLNLTAAVRTAIAKYPWTSTVDPADIEAHGAPRGVRLANGEARVRKYSAYAIDAVDLERARAEHGSLRPFEQSVEAAVMDVADDVAYSIHDVDDFYRAGILGHTSISSELREWTERAGELRATDDDELVGSIRPGAGLELLRRKMHRDDAWIASDDAFADAVATIADDLVDGLLARPYDGSITAERTLSSFTSRWIAHLQQSVVATGVDTLRAGPVTLEAGAWHEVEILKFVHKRFVLDRPDLAMYQRGLGRSLVRTVRSLIAWLDDEHDSARVPARLRELIELAREGYRRTAIERPSLVRPLDGAAIERASVSRGVIDYVASLSDSQALAVSEAVSGRADRLWTLGQSL